MDNKKFEQLIDLIINEDEEKARALFHDIVVEKSREIYESIMEQEEIEEAKEEDNEDAIEESFDDMEEASLDEVGGLMDEVRADESGLGEEDEEFADIEVDDETGLGDEEGEVEVDGDTEIKDELLNIEDKLDELMSEFEELMAKIDGEEAGEEDFGDEEGEEDFGDEEDMMEAVQLQKVSVTHGDNGQQTKSTVAANSGAKGMASKPVSMGNGSESVPNGPKGPSNAYSKGETQVKGATSWKNAPAQAGQDLEKAPAPKHGDNGQNTKSVIEGRQTTKKRI